MRRHEKALALGARTTLKTQTYDGQAVFQGSTLPRRARAEAGVLCYAAGAERCERGVVPQQLLVGVSSFSDVRLDKQLTTVAQDPPEFVDQRPLQQHPLAMALLPPGIGEVDVDPHDTRFGQPGQHLASVLGEDARPPRRSAPLDALVDVHGPLLSDLERQQTYFRVQIEFA